MYGINDKVNLVVGGAIDLEGNNLSFISKLPLEEDLIIPEKAARVLVYEYCEGLLIGGGVAFKIFIGKECKFSDLYKKKVLCGPLKFASINEEIDNLDNNICYQINLDGNLVILGKVNDNDIVVSSLDEMKKVIMNISDDFLDIKNKIRRVRSMARNSQISNTTE